MFITYYLWGLTQRFHSYAPFQNSYMYTIFFHSFQVINMHFYMFWLIFCDKEGIGGTFITMNDSSLIFDIQNNFSKQFFAIYNKHLSCGNGSLVFQNSLNPGASWGPLTPWTTDQGFALDPPRALQPPAPIIIFRLSILGNVHPCKSNLRCVL